MFDNGFVPRITDSTRADFVRALHPPTLDDQEGLTVPWAIVDPLMAAADPELVGQLGVLGTRCLADTQPWRYRDVLTWQSPKWSSLPFTPAGAYDGSVDWLEKLVVADLSYQNAVGAAAYIITGFFPSDRRDDLRPVQEQVLAIAERALQDLPARPVLAFLGARMDALSAASHQLKELPPTFDGVVVQLTPASPRQFSTDRLAAATRLLVQAESHGLRVLAGHLAAASVPLLSIGVTATSAGLAVGEAFDFRKKINESKPRKPSGSGSGHRQGRRVYLQQFGLSVGGGEFQRIGSVPVIRELLLCRDPCHRFKPFDRFQETAVEHSLRGRLSESARVFALAPSMRIAEARQTLKDIRDRIAMANGALRANNLEELPVSQVDTQLAMLDRFAHAQGAA